MEGEEGGVRRGGEGGELWRGMCGVRGEGEGVGRGRRQVRGAGGRGVYGEGKGEGGWVYGVSMVSL